MSSGVVGCAACAGVPSHTWVYVLIQFLHVRLRLQCDAAGRLLMRRPTRSEPSVHQYDVYMRPSFIANERRLCRSTRGFLTKSWLEVPLSTNNLAHQQMGPPTSLVGVALLGLLIHALQCALFPEGFSVV
jgi:hypothetical protein